MAVTYSNDFAEKSNSPHKQPRFVVAVDFSGVGADWKYFKSHADIAGVTGGYDDIIDKISVSSQFIQPDKGISTIGSLSFSLLDKDDVITNLLRDKLDAGFGIRKKPVVIWYGYKDVNFANFIELQTQLIDKDVIEDKGEYIFNCSDVQRNLKEQIFDLGVSNLARTINASTTTIYTYESPWEFCTHGNSYSDAPNTNAAYIKIEDEIIRIITSVVDTTLGESLFKLTVVRGVLGTVEDEHDFNEETTEPDKRPVITEVVYLEMPMPKMLHAIISGSLYGQAGSTFPSNWTINLSGSFIRLADYLNIGSDWWDPTNDNVGKILRFIGETRQEAKTFIEKQLLLPYGAIMPIYGTGEMGLKKTTNILADAPFTITLDASNITKISPLKHDLKSVINEIIVNWNYDILLESFTRSHVLTDPDSKSTHLEATPKTVNYRGVHGSRDTYSTIKSMFDNHRDRWSGPPLRLSVECLPSLDTLEVGDVVRVNIDNVRDFSNGSITRLNRSFEIQKISTNWITGVIKLELFGSSQKAGIIKNLSDVEVLADTFYSTVGTDLASLPETSVVGSVLHIDTDLDLSGHSDATNNSAIYYSTIDLELDSDIVLTVNDNVQIRFRGHFQVNGTIDGVGRGIAGGAATTNLNPTPTTGGAYGISQSEGGVSRVGNVYQGRHEMQSVQGVLSIPTVVGNSVPFFDISYNSGNNTIIGLPTELRGVPGSSGTGAYEGGQQTGFNGTAAGGTGGTGGAGLLLIGRGMSFGASGSITLAGDDGGLPDGLYPDIFAYLNVLAGAGGGGCGGGLFYLADGSGSITPNLFSKFSSVRGATQNGDVRQTDPKQHQTVLNPAYHKYNLYTNVGSQSNHSYYKGHGAAIDNGKSMYRTQYIPSVYIVQVDASAYAPRPVSITATEILNTPRTQKANLSTIQVTVQPPISSAYNYAEVYYRETGKKDWYKVGAADDTTTFVVPSDGTAYDIFAKTISFTKKVGKGGVGTSVTTTNIENPLADLGELQVPNVNGLEIFNQGNETVFTGKEVKLEWRKSSLNEWHNLGYEPVSQGSGVGGEDLFFRDYEVVVINHDTDVELRTEYVTDNFYFYSHEKNFEDTNGSPVRKLRIEVRQRSRQNSFSVRPAKLVVENESPVLPSVTITAGLKSIGVEFPRPSDLDWVGTKVYISTSSGFTSNASTLVYEDVGSTIIIPDLIANQLYYIRFRLYDDFGDGDLSVEYSATTNGVLSADLDATPPTNPTNLVLTSSVEDSKLYVKSEITATWDTSTDDSGQPINYVVEFWDSVNTTKIQLNTINLTHRITDAVVGRTYSVRIKAVDWASNESGWTTTSTKVAAGDTTAPSNITSLSATSGLDKVVLNWVNPTNDNFLTARIHRGTTSGFTPASGNLIYDGLGDTTIDGDVTNGTTYYYKSATVSVSGNVSSYSVAVSATPFKLTTSNITGFMDAGAVDTAQIAVDAITTNEISVGAVTTVEISNDAITTAKIAVGAITTVEISNDAITSTKISNDAITTPKIATNAITANEIAVGTITASEIAAGAITASKILAGTITASEIAAGAITTNELSANSVNASKIIAGTITANEIAAGAITANEIAAGTITASEISAGAITATEIAAGTITASKIAADTITAANIAAGAITASEIAAGAITATKIAANSIDASKIIANSITASEISASSITATEMSITTLSTLSANMGTLTAGTITGATIRTAASGARVQLVSTGLEVYDATTRRVHFANNGSGYIGSASQMSWTTAGVLTVAKINAQSGDIGGFDITSTQIKNSAGTLVIDSNTLQISAGSTTFGGAGFQAKYTGTSGELYTGDGDQNFLKYTSSGGVQVGRNSVLRGTNSWGSDTIHEVFTNFKNGSATGNSDPTYKVKIGTVFGGSGWYSSTIDPGLAGQFYLRTDVNANSGVRMRRVQDLRTTSGKFNAFRAIKAKFQVSTLTNMNMKFSTGLDDVTDNNFGFTMNSSGQIKVFSTKSGAAYSPTTIEYTVSPYVGFTLEAFYDPTGPHIKWYINGTLVDTLTNTSQIPGNSPTSNNIWWTLDWWTTSTSSPEGRILMNAIEFLNEPT